MPEWGEIGLREGVLRRGERTVDLREQEATLLSYLLSNAGGVVRRETLLTEVWGYHSNTQTRVISVTIARLRKKLEALGLTDCLRTVRGVGYQLTLPDGALASSPPPPPPPPPRWAEAAGGGCDRRRPPLVSRSGRRRCRR